MFGVMCFSPPPEPVFLCERNTALVYRPDGGVGAGGWYMRNESKRDTTTTGNPANEREIVE